MSAVITKPTISNSLGDAATVYLDALRAIASNLVIAAHVLLLYFGIKDPYSLGNFGVAIFFLLSGFLITQSMMNWTKKPEPHFPGFLADRVARIFTPYIPALIVIVFANLTLIGEYTGNEGHNTGLLPFFGNLLMLQDHSVFQLAQMAGIELPWRIRPYNGAEPFWTVAIEMWIYVSMGLFFFCLVRRERIDKRYLIALTLISFPVLVWNAAAGGGKSLTLIWLLGAAAGYLFYEMRHAISNPNVRGIGIAMIIFGAIGLAGRIGKVGFQPYDVQSAALIGMLMFGVLACLTCVSRVPKALARASEFLASYSYSLYLIHNTVLIVAVEWLDFGSLWLSIACGVVLSHLTAFALYLAFERHYRSVARWLRPKFERALLPASARAAEPSIPQSASVGFTPAKES